MPDNVRVLPMAGQLENFCLNKSIVKELIVEIMILSTTENVKQEPKLNSEPQPIVSTSPPAIGNTNVTGSAVCFRIHGRARKELKKKVGFLKGYVRHFWQFEDCNQVNGAWLDDAECQRRINNAKNEIKYLENKLNETL